MVTQICKKGLFGLLILIIVLSSCTKGGIKTVDSSTYQPAVPKPLDVGSVTFDVDPTHTASMDYTVDNNKDQVLKMTDASGLTWSLTLSPGTLGYDQTITMTALNDVTSKDIPGKLIGGVLLGPDGTILSVPATITVSGTGKEAVLLFFTGKQDGSNAEFALPARDQAQNSATIFHFSSFWSDDVATEKTNEDPNWGNYMKGLGNNLDAIIAEAQAMLKKPMTYPVPPPSVELSGCKDNQGKKDDSARIDQYLEQFMQPEVGFIGQLMGIKNAQGQATGQWEVFNGEPVYMPGAYDPRIDPLIDKLIGRIIKKFIKLMEEYGKKTQYLAAMGQMMLRLKFQVGLINADYSASFVDLDEYLKALLNTAYNELIQKIIQQHDYNAATEVFNLSKQAALLGYRTGEEQDLNERIQKAMTFKMKGNYTWHTMDTQWELKTDFIVSPNFDSFGKLNGSGPGTIDYKYTGPSGRSTRDPGGFNEEATIKLDICNNKAAIIVYPYAAESDTIHIEDITKTIPLSMTAWTGGFSDHEAKSAAGDPMGAWGFEDTFWNLNPNPFNGVFDAKSPTSKFAGVFTITLEHTPQK